MSKKKCKVFINTQPVIIIDDEYFEVDTFMEGIKLKKNVAYIVGDYVYIYRGKYKSDDSYKPGIYKKDDEYIFVEPDKKRKDKFSIDNINELSPTSIFEQVENNVEDFVQLSDIETINNNSEIFTPMLKDDDDFLKHIVKKIILDKKINLKNYKSRFSNEYALNNMKSGLSKTTKMTVPNFMKWCEILGVDWEMTVTDSGEDNLNPLSETIRVSNKDY